MSAEIVFHCNSGRFSFERRPFLFCAPYPVAFAAECGSRIEKQDDPLGHHSHLLAGAARSGKTLLLDVLEDA